MKVRIQSRKAVVAATAFATIAGAFSLTQFIGTSAASAKPSHAQPTLLDAHKLILRSAK